MIALSWLNRENSLVIHCASRLFLDIRSPRRARDDLKFRGELSRNDSTGGPQSRIIGDIVYCCQRISCISGHPRVNSQWYKTMNIFLPGFWSSMFIPYLSYYLIQLNFVIVRRYNFLYTFFAKQKFQRPIFSQIHRETRQRRLDKED